MNETELERDYREAREQLNRWIFLWGELLTSRILKQIVYKLWLICQYCEYVKQFFLFSIDRWILLLVVNVSTQLSRTEILIYEGSLWKNWHGLSKCHNTKFLLRYYRFDTQKFACFLRCFIALLIGIPLRSFFNEKWTFLRARELRSEVLQFYGKLKCSNLQLHNNKENDKVSAMTIQFSVWPDFSSVHLQHCFWTKLCFKQLLNVFFNSLEMRTSIFQSGRRLPRTGAGNHAGPGSM